jgi:hypothetical protein
MSAEERKKILQMVQDGKISAEQAASLMRALEADDTVNPAEAEMEVIEAGASSDSERIDAPEFEQVKARARRFAMIPLWAGVFLTVPGACIRSSRTRASISGSLFSCSHFCWVCY